MEGKSRVLEDKNGDSFLVITHNKEAKEESGNDYSAANMDIFRSHQFTEGPPTQEEIDCMNEEEQRDEADYEKCTL